MYINNFIFSLILAAQKMSGEALYSCLNVKCSYSSFMKLASLKLCLSETGPILLNRVL